MSSDTHSSAPMDLVDYIDHYLPDDEVLSAARNRSTDLGCTAISTAAGMTLRFLASTLTAKAVVEIGTGVGVSGLYLLGGMAEDSVLTTIDSEPEHHRTARSIFAAAGFSAGRTRLIMGQALEVLPRLTTGGYDLVFVDAAKVEYPRYYEQGTKLLRPGGMIVFHDVLTDGAITNQMRRDPESLALREVAKSVRENEQLVPALLPIGGGLLVATVW